jgi:hypothetical protein
MNGEQFETDLHSQMSSVPILKSTKYCLCIEKPKTASFASNRQNLNLDRNELRISQCHEHFEGV